MARLLSAMGGDREAVGDAIYGLKINALVAIKEGTIGHLLFFWYCSNLPLCLGDRCFLLLSSNRSSGLLVHGFFCRTLEPQDNFTTPRAVVSLRFFNCFRLLLEKADNENELKIYVETLAFKHLDW